MLAVQVTLRYSDAPKTEVSVVIAEKDGKKSEISGESAPEESYVKYRI